MKLTKIHKVLKFKQSDWIKVYINFNTGKRKKNAANSLEKVFFKLKINSACGKTIENFRKRVGKKKKKKEKKKTKEKDC